MHILLIAILLTVTGCSDRYESGYRRGAADTVLQLRAQEQQWRKQMEQEMPKRLLPGILLTMTGILFGDRLLSILRKQLNTRLHLSYMAQLCCFLWLFRFLLSGAAGWMILRLPGNWRFPLLPLLLGGIWLTECRLPAAFSKERPELFRLVLTKLKALLFLLLTLLLLYELLTGAAPVKLLPGS